jgi:hypothetical protein
MAPDESSKTMTCSRTAVTNEKYIKKEIKSRLNCENICYTKFRIFVSLSPFLNVKILQNYCFARV